MGAWTRRIKLCRGSGIIHTPHIGNLMLPCKAEGSATGIMDYGGGGVLVSQAASQPVISRGCPRRRHRWFASVTHRLQLHLLWTPSASFPTDVICHKNNNRTGVRLIETRFCFLKMRFEKVSYPSAATGGPYSSSYFIFLCPPSFRFPFLIFYSFLTSRSRHPIPLQ
jgi:hypothetical protein